MGTHDLDPAEGLATIAPPGASVTITVSVVVRKCNAGVEFAVVQCRSPRLARRAIVEAHQRWRREASESTDSAEIRRRVLDSPLRPYKGWKTAWVGLEPWGFALPGGGMKDTGSTPTEFRERCLAAYQAPLGWVRDGSSLRCESTFEVEVTC